MPDPSENPPARPQLAVSAAIFRDGKVLLVRRARSPEAVGGLKLTGGLTEVLEAALRLIQT